MPVTPVETPQNLNPGGTWASGTTPVSGITTSSYAGPWYIEEQSLTIDYHRIPLGALSATDLNLSSNTISFRNAGTELLAEVTAKYRSRKDWSTYDTSTAQVPQTFQILAFSADTRGNQYGALTASTLGPQGTIVTKTPYYRRVPWNSASGHVEASGLCTGATYFAVADKPYTLWDCTSGTPKTIDQTRLNDSWEHWFVDYKTKGYLETPEIGPICDQLSWMYYLPGSYSVDQENMRFIIQFIDRIGDYVAHGILYSIPAVWNCSRSTAETDQGVQQYDITRHNYSG